MEQIRQSPASRGLVVAMSLILVAAVMAAPGCSRRSSDAIGHEAGEPVPDGGHGSGSIILISLDTLRRDAVGAYLSADQRAGSSTPALDRLANEAVVFERAYAPVPHTLVSHMTMLTGVDPLVHQVATKESRLSQHLLTAAEVLHGAGYRTAAITSVDWLFATFGFDRGFETYVQMPFGMVFADRITTRALATVDRIGAGPKPFFLFLHYYDAHSDWGVADNPNGIPYYSPPAYRADLPDDRVFCTAEGKCASEYLAAARHQEGLLPSDELALHRTMYLRGVRFLDDHLARLFKGLRQRSLFDSSLIIVIADHGEELGEHGSLLHSRTYEETVAVPLIVKPPRGTFLPARVQALVGVIDVMPTLLDHAGIPAPEQVQGRSLLRQIGSAPVDPERAILSRSADALRPSTIWTSCSDLRGPAPGQRDELDHLKLIACPGQPPELYDLASDPEERHSLAVAMPEEVARLVGMRDALAQESEELRQRLEGSASTGEQVLGEEELRRLEALGYAEQ